jgi:hypothetical protein
MHNYSHYTHKNSKTEKNLNNFPKCPVNKLPNWYLNPNPSIFLSFSLFHAEENILQKKKNLN